MTAKEKRFIATVWDYYQTNGRSTLPWRKTKNPYRILVSEIMLQQTQVDRVIPKYQYFIDTWPGAPGLAATPLAEVLRAWQGLGYNRRAKMLQQAIQAVEREHKGVWPKSREALESLPGVGPYTAGAVLAFAFNIPTVLIETNIRTAYLHHFFTDQMDVSERDILTLIERTLDEKNPREWYWALMDYGAYIKKTFGNHNRRAKNYAKQSAFKGSDREIRGAIIKALSEKPQSETALKKLGFVSDRLNEQLSKLEKERLITRRGRRYSLTE